MRPSRRRFLQVGLAGAAILAVARLLERASPDGAIVAALAPVILAGALPAEPRERAAAIARVVQSVEDSVRGLAPAAQSEVRELFALLRFAPTRFATTGLGKPLPEADGGDIAAFLTRWRDSRFDLLRAGYQGLTQLLHAAWYDDPRAWAAVGYPGPPALSRP